MRDPSPPASIAPQILFVFGLGFIIENVLFQDSALLALTGHYAGFWV